MEFEFETSIVVDWPIAPGNEALLLWLPRDWPVRELLCMMLFCIFPASIDELFVYTEDDGVDDTAGPFSQMF